MKRRTFIIILVLLLVGGVVLTQLRHYIPELQTFFIQAGLEEHFVTIEIAVSEFIGGNPSAIVSIIFGTVSFFTALIFRSRDKISGLINSFSSEKAGLESQILSLTGETERLQGELQTQLSTLKGTYQNLEMQYNELKAGSASKIQELTTEVSVNQNKVIELQAALQDALTERDSYRIQLEEKKVPTLA